MAGMTTKQRDLEATRTGLERWLGHRWPHATDLQLAPLTTTDTSGRSSETLFLDAAFQQEGIAHTASLVARMPPLGDGVFAEYDIEREWRVQDLLHRRGLPVAEQIGYEPDPGYVGSPFLVMQRVPGNVPIDAPPFFLEGWLHDASATEQRATFGSALETMVKLHSVDVDAVGLRFLERPQGPGLSGEMAWWREYLDWAADGSPPSTIVDLFAWCEANRPSTNGTNGLAWGDARLGNMLFGADGRVAAILDWEMVTLGPPQLDVGFFLSVRQMMRTILGAPDPELPGFPDRDGTVTCYEDAGGQAVTDLDWYELFAMFRTGSILVSMNRLLRAAGWDVSLDPVPSWVLDRMANC
jgi:aminoglycoside phosphotransferase (APT) family kinase protein